MSIKITLDLPDDLAHRVHAAATLLHRPFEDLLVEWIERAAEPSVDSLPDEQVVALCNSRMEPLQQSELSDLLAASREGSLTTEQRAQLEGLMQLYRHGLLRKSQALLVAVKRGLRPPLN